MENTISILVMELFLCIIQQESSKDFVTLFIIWLDDWQKLCKIEDLVKILQVTKKTPNQIP